MKESFWGYWLVILGIFVVVIMLLIQNITSNSTQDYYSIKEISEAAMVDAVDLGYYRDYGELKINKETSFKNSLKLCRPFLSMEFANDVIQKKEI